MYKNDHSQILESKLLLKGSTVVYSYIGILRSYENEQTLSIYNNTDESHTHLLEQRQPDTKGLHTM